MDLFIKNYSHLHTYAESLLYRTPWLKGKGYSAKDIVHETYIVFQKYKEKFNDYNEEKLTQVFKNLVYWTFKHINRSVRDTNVEDFILDTAYNYSIAEDNILKKELEKAVKTIDKKEADIINLRLSGYTFKEINSMKNITNSQSILDVSMTQLAYKLGFDNNQKLTNKLTSYIKDNLSITEMQKKTGMSNYFITRHLKSILGNKYKDYTRLTQKKK